MFGETLVEMVERLKFFDERIKRYEQRVKQLFEQDERCQRLAQIQGLGPLIATALVAAVGDAGEFSSGRELSAWLGLVPRQQSSGGRNVLLGITKRGDRYLRMLLIYGARAALRYAERRTLEARRGPNVAAVAVANKNPAWPGRYSAPAKAIVRRNHRPPPTRKRAERAHRLAASGLATPGTARRRGSETGSFSAALQLARGRTEKLL